MPPSDQAEAQAPMPKKEELKKVLLAGVERNRKHITEQQLEAAASELVTKSSTTKPEVVLLGEVVTRDREMFAVVDIGDINDVLKGTKGN